MTTNKKNADAVVTFLIIIPFIKPEVLSLNTSHLSSHFPECRRVIRSQIINNYCQGITFGGKVAETGDWWNPWGRKGAMLDPYRDRFSEQD
jgi:hypothetical protein